MGMEPDRTASAPSPGGRLTNAQLLIFGLPALPHAIVMTPISTLLPTFYAAHTTVSLAQIGVVAAAARIFDALNDPIVGYLSDRTHTRLGSRKPWLIGAIIVCTASITQLFQPPADATALYYALWSCILFTGFTMFEIPRTAWSSELTRDYRERSRIVMYVALFNIMGSLLLYVTPIITSLITGGSTKMGPDTLATVSWAYMVVMPLSVIATIILVPQGTKVVTHKATMRGIAASLWRSKPLLRFCCIMVLWGLGQGANLATVFIFQTDYMHLGAEFAFIMIVLMSLQITALPVWSRILGRVDRHHIWAIVMGGGALLTPIALFFPRGPEALIPVLILAAFKGLLMAPTNFLPTAVLGDVIDYDTMKTGSNKAGNFFAFKSILSRIALAIGGAIAFGILGAFDYQVGKENDATANLGLLIAYMGVPMVFHLAMAALCWTFPIDSRRHKVIQRRLETRRARLEGTPKVASPLIAGGALPAAT
ncbi:Isoprimeverose transporter [Alphaproteobacteria bacterium SO-S41]|nr:Isoprimeverose transporter [Alphaproteobacteria bacterium SO-S41]